MPRFSQFIAPTGEESNYRIDSRKIYSNAIRSAVPPLVAVGIVLYAFFSVFGAVHIRMAYFARIFYAGVGFGGHRSRVFIQTGMGARFPLRGLGWNGAVTQAPLGGVGPEMERNGKIGGNQVCPILFGTSRARLWLEVAFNEGVKQIVGDEEQEGACQ
jgi:hypothetical protein